MQTDQSARSGSWILALITVAAGLSAPTPAGGDAIDRLQIGELEKLRGALTLLRQDLEPVTLSSGFTDYRAVMHVHSHWSHDSRGTPEEIREAAQKAGVSVVMFTEHPAPHYDFFTDGHRGLEAGVLFIPGAETRGLQKYPLASVKDLPADTPQQEVDSVRATGGMAFLCHLEERMDWTLDNLTGSEIYNIHADAKDETRLFAALRNPLTVFPLLAAFEQYPQESFAALQNYPADYLRRWDKLCRTHRLTGIAANDAHHNQGLHVFIGEDGALVVHDGLDEPVLKIDPEQKPAVKVLMLGKQPGDTIFKLDLDPYERSFRHVSTHLLMHELTENAVREALQAGRAYVAFDWIADPTGFTFQARREEKITPMGDEVAWEDGLKLEAASPLPATFRLLRDGVEVTSHVGRTFDFTPQHAGNYRIEVWVNLPDGPQIWILSNPVSLTVR
ncbi:MAG: PHP domain-containing protein [Planctomycetaceae bacterium]|nr:PHP domain-containing protein [Planctomycetaceae bacterium]